MIIDSHAHFSKNSAVWVFDTSTEACIEHMDRIGGDFFIQSLSSAFDGFPYDDYVPQCLRLYNESGGRILSYFVYDPNFADATREMIKAHHSDPAFVGIKIHPSDHKVMADDERYRIAWELAYKYGLPLMSHSWTLTANPKQKYATPDKFEKYITEYKNVKFIFGHSGGRTAGIKEVVSIGKKNKNVYFDLAGDIYNRGLIEYLAENAGAGHVLLASDVNWFDLSVQIGMVLGAELPTEDKKLILGGNAAEIFGIKC